LIEEINDSLIILVNFERVKSKWTFYDPFTLLLLFAIWFNVFVVWNRNRIRCLYSNGWFLLWFYCILKFQPLMSSVSLKMKFQIKTYYHSPDVCVLQIFSAIRKNFGIRDFFRLVLTQWKPQLQKKTFAKMTIGEILFFWLLDWKNHKSLIGKNTCKKWKKKCFNTFLSISLSFLVSFCFIKCLGLLNQNNFFIWSKIFSFEIDGTMIVQNWCHCWNGRIFS